jgi:hypothetical protein
VRIVLPPEVDEQRAVRDELAYGYLWWLAPDLGQGAYFVGRLRRSIRD